MQFAESCHQRGPSKLDFLPGTVLQPRGRDVGAACGQLKSASERKRRAGAEA